MNLRPQVVCLIALAGGGADAATAAQAYAEVLGSVPVYRQVQVAEPQDRCMQQRVVDSSVSDANAAAGTVLGGVAGGVLGNTIGNGTGRALATVTGAVLGAVAGNQVATAASPQPSEHVEERCQRVIAYRTENRLDGYDVTYRYNGQTYRTHLREDPGPRMPVQVNVQPAVY
jgi:uncharacterized protein YcfJ